MHRKHSHLLNKVQQQEGDVVSISVAFSLRGSAEAGAGHLPPLGG